MIKIEMKGLRILTISNSKENDVKLPSNLLLNYSQSMV